MATKWEKLGFKSRDEARIQFVKDCYSYEFENWLDNELADSEPETIARTDKRQVKKE